MPAHYRVVSSSTRRCYCSSANSPLDSLNTQSHEAISKLSWPATQAHGPPALGTRNGKDVLVSSELSIKTHLPSCSSHQAITTFPEQSPENSFRAKGSIFPFCLYLPSSSQSCQAQEPKLSATSAMMMATGVQQRILPRCLAPAAVAAAPPPRAEWAACES